MTASCLCKFGNDEGARLVGGGVAAKSRATRTAASSNPLCLPTSRRCAFSRRRSSGLSRCHAFEDEDDALRLANDSPFGLAAAVRTRDVSRAHASRARVRAGIVWINDHHRLDPASPWGGVGDSGIGREFGTESFDDHFDVKSVMLGTHEQPFDGIAKPRDNGG